MHKALGSISSTINFKKEGKWRQKHIHMRRIPCEGRSEEWSGTSTSQATPRIAAVTRS
jgi:hypothetical protein